MGIHAQFALAARAAIEAEIEAHLQRVSLLIARLDRADGDCDLEDDDPPGDPLDRGEGDTYEGAGGGSGFDARLQGNRPRYGINQTCGPINIAGAARERLVRELGLVRSPTGGWRQPR